MLDDLEDPDPSAKLLVYGKARQDGASWTAAGASLWDALFNTPVKVGVLSKGERGAAEFIEEKVRFIWSRLPAYLQAKLTTDNSEELVWDNGSRIVGFPSSSDAGRHTNFSKIFVDEGDFQPDFDGLYTSLKSTVDDGPAKLILMSTSNPKTIDSAFKRVFRDAPGNHFRKRFWSYDLRPGRDQAWWEARRVEAVDEEGFIKEYPRNEEDFLSAARTVMAFDKAALDAMKGECKEAIAW